MQERRVQTVTVVAGPRGEFVDLRCACRKLLFKWTSEEQVAGGALEIEIQCPRCHAKTVFQFPRVGPAVDC